MIKVNRLLITLTTWVGSVSRVTWVKCISLAMWQPNRIIPYNSASKAFHVLRVCKKNLHEMNMMISNEGATRWISIYVRAISVCFNKTSKRFYPMSIAFKYILNLRCKTTIYLFIDLINHINHLGSKLIPKFRLFRRNYRL
jgi:hypothetical protein